MREAANRGDDDAGRGVVLQILYRHILRSSSRRSRLFSNQEEAVVSPYSAAAIPAGPLRILSKEEAQALDARCRFCFDGHQEEDDGERVKPDQDYRLVAPCRCAGSSEYVHIACLRQWQRHASRQKAAFICSVCTSPYALRPPPPRRLKAITRGTLLVSKPDVDSGIFNQSVVLMLAGTNQDELPFGVIINKAAPAVRGWNFGGTSANDNVALLSRTGGPVCAGRLGVLRYMILHTAKQQLQGNQGRWIFKPVFTEGQQEESLQLLQDSESVYDRESEALLERDQMQDFRRALESSSTTQEGQDVTAILFLGYCSWGRGQLEREIQRDFWHICQGNVDDVVGPNAPNLWETLTSETCNRLIPTEDLYEDSE